MYKKLLPKLRYVRIIVASSSKNRVTLLRSIGLYFIEFVDSGVKESSDSDSPYKIAVNNALRKAKAVAAKVKDAIVIGVDTIVYINGEVLGKPKSVEEAEDMLRKLRGRKHKVISGIAIIDSDTGRLVTDYEETTVYVKELSDEAIKNYVLTGEPLGKAGGYGIQGLGSLIIDRIEGCYYNVVGFPLTKVNDILVKHFNIDLIKEYLRHTGRNPI